MDGDWLNTDEAPLKSVDEARRRLLRLGAGALSNTELVGVLLGGDELDRAPRCWSRTGSRRCSRSRPRR